MNIYLQTLAETGQIVLPIFFLLTCGYLLRRMGTISHEFVDQSSRLVFTVALPLLIFLNVSKVDLNQILSAEKLIYTAIATAFSGIVFFLIALKWIRSPDDQGVFAQGCFRSNFAIIGLAIIYNIYGDTGLAIGSLMLAVVMPIYNILSVVFLTMPMKGDMRPLPLLKSVMTNPLMLAVFFALPVSYFDWSMPAIMTTTGRYFSDMTLPLALLAIGASLDGRHLRHSSSLAVYTSLIKTLWQPLTLTFGGWLIGFSPDELVILFILFGCPAAASGFVMVKNMGGNAQLAANTVALSTLISIITLSTGIFVLKLIFA